MTELDDEWNEQFHNKEDSKEDKKANHKTKIPTRKFTANGRMPLHESVVIGTTPNFVTIKKDKGGKIDVEFKTEIETPEGEIFIPNDTIYTQSPFPYVFDSKEEFKQYIEYASKFDLDSLFSLVETEYRKYVDVEGYYYTLLTGDTILSYFQDIFPYTHYIIIVGDNDSGKNSALLTYKFLGYRVFYVTSASAPNYFTVLGNREEGQVTIAEDEADDLAIDKDKRNVFKTGYCSGASIPKVETHGGRKQDNWLVYCQKWVAMEELPENRNMKGILDRSLVLKFITGSPQYNIKEVIRSGKDPEYEPLYDKLIDIRKILFCYRLIHHEDNFLNVKLNVKNRTAELIKPLIRLSNNAPITRQRILEDLSKFINERNKTKKESFEAKIYKAIIELITEREELIKKGIMDKDELDALGTHIFSNESIRYACRIEMDGRDIEGKDTAFYSPDFAQVTQKKITNILMSKFKAKRIPIRIGKNTFRCVQFDQKTLDNIGSYYDMRDQIKILEDSENVTDVTDVTLPGIVNGSQEGHLGSKDTENNDCIAVNNTLEQQGNTEKQKYTVPETVTSVTSVTDNEKPNVDSPKGEGE